MASFHPLSLCMCRCCYIPWSSLLTVVYCAAKSARVAGVSGTKGGTWSTRNEGRPDYFESVRLLDVFHYNTKKRQHLKICDFVANVMKFNISITAEVEGLTMKWKEKSIIYGNHADGTLKYDKYKTIMMYFYLIEEDKSVTSVTAKFVLFLIE